MKLRANINRLHKVPESFDKEFKIFKKQLRQRYFDTFKIDTLTSPYFLLIKLTPKETVRVDLRKVLKMLSEVNTFFHKYHPNMLEGEFAVIDDEYYQRKKKTVEELKNDTQTLISANSELLTFV